VVNRRTATSVVRDELVQVRARKACDRRAELAGLLRSAGTFQVLGSGRYALEATSEHAGVARRIYEALSQALGARGEVRLLEPGRGHPHKRYAVRAETTGLQRLVEAGILDDVGTPGGRVPRRVVAKRCCVGAFLRGAFLARGSVSDPKAAAHLEIRAANEDTARDLALLMLRTGADARAREHKVWAAYVKSTTGIGSVLAAMGAHESYLRWEAGSVWKSVHVAAGRLANADAANARRLARAAVTHLAAIDELDQARGIRALPAALREVAELRRRYPEASLEELGRMCSPPITKAATADRLRRIAREAGFEPARSHG
jgi:DNA-binding protein WhiA